MGVFISHANIMPVCIWNLSMLGFAVPGTHNQFPYILMGYYIKIAVSQVAEMEHSHKLRNVVSALGLFNNKLLHPVLFYFQRVS